MSYETVIEGLHARFATVVGLEQNNILDHEPTSVTSFPTLYSLLDRFDRKEMGGVTKMTYRTLHRLLFRWQDNKQAEVELRSFVNKVAAAVDADPQLNDTLNGLATIADGQ